MSKIGEKPVVIKEGVSIIQDKEKILIKGKEGELMINLPPDLVLENKDNLLFLKRKNNKSKVKALHGLYRQLINNAVIGVNKRWEKRLEIVGTGYNVKLQGEDLVFKLGYSHPVIFKKREGIKFNVEGNNKVIVSGCDKQLVGEIAYQIKMLKKPDAYKGKGIRYEDEKLRIKPGKKAKATSTGA
ncbi:MAG: 50S ribosomal protein L6 [Patescibacteria group bacterium]|nr:50S ribosomal protein L6 [Patescibacteria group bacterium]